MKKHGYWIWMVHLSCKEEGYIVQWLLVKSLWWTRNLKLPKLANLLCWTSLFRKVTFPVVNFPSLIVLIFSPFPASHFYLFMRNLAITVNHVVATAPEAHTTAEKEHKQRGNYVHFWSLHFHSQQTENRPSQHYPSPAFTFMQQTRKVEIVWALRVL